MKIVNRLSRAKSRYKKWMLDIVGRGKIDSNYGYLIYILMHKKYYYTLPGDQNRYDDGIYLRELFLYETGLPDDYFVGSELPDGPSILEILVMFSKRAYKEIIGGDPEKNGPQMIFWKMIENLNLSEYDDTNVDVGEIEDILDRWMANDIKKDGSGGPFYVRNNRKIDMRKLDLWQQINVYWDNF